MNESVPASEPHRLPRIERGAQEEGNGRPRQDPAAHQLRGESQHEPAQHVHEQELDEIVEGEAEESVDVAGAHHRLEKSGFERGCPFATVALESGAHDEALRRALADGFDAIRRRLAAMLTLAGAGRTTAHRLALLIVSAYEGALLQARVAGSVKPVADTAAMLVELVREEVGPGRATR
jgi:hypothetical protein